MPARRAHRPLALGSSHWREDGQPKVRYPSRHEAGAAASVRSMDSGVELGVYECPYCRGWHMGRPEGRPTGEAGSTG